MVNNIHGVFRAAINGVHQRDEGGFVYVKDDRCGYMFPCELQHAPAREMMQQLLDDKEKACQVFYVLEERDGKLHVLAYPRVDVFQKLCRAPDGAESAPAAAAAPCITELD